MVATIKSKKRVLQRVLAEYEISMDELLTLSDTPDKDEDLELRKAKESYKHIQKAVTFALTEKRSKLDLIRPRFRGDSEIDELVKLIKEVKSGTAKTNLSTTNRKLCKVGDVAFGVRIAALVQRDRTLPDNLTWRLRFRCLKPPGHEETWSILGFEPKDFSAWWWKGRSEYVAKETVVWEDVRYLARKVYYMRSRVMEECMRMSVQRHRIEASSLNITDMAKTYFALLTAYSDKRKLISPTFEFIIPLLYAFIGVLLDAYDVAFHQKYLDDTYNSRINRHLDILEPLITIAHESTKALEASLKETSLNLRTRYSIEEVIRMCEPIALEEKLVDSPGELRSLVTKTYETKVQDSNEKHPDIARFPPIASRIGSVVTEDSVLNNLGLKKLTVSEECEEWIGDGSYGEVYRMKLCFTPRWCAVKKANPRANALQRIYREAEVWAKLDHFNILPLLGYTFLNGQTLPSFVSPLCVDNLHRFLKLNRINPDNELDKSSKLSELERLHLIDDISDGLEHLHELEIAHGDMKTVNILIRRQDSGEFYAVLCDFGMSLSKTQDCGNCALEGDGNKMWLSPELLCVDRASGMRVSIKGDVWAFGCVYLEVITGIGPYESVSYSPSELLADSVKLPADKTKLIGLQEQHWNIISNCWTANAEERPDMAVVGMMVKDLVFLLSK